MNPTNPDCPENRLRFGTYVSHITRSLNEYHETKRQLQALQKECNGINALVDRLTVAMSTTRKARDQPKS